MPRSIVHLDADAFFASVEQASDHHLRGRPIAVGGEKRGIIASASYEARRFGIYTPMPTALARRLCPKLVVLPGDFAKYELFSNLMFSYAYDFTPEVEIGSIDEGYFDLTGARKPALDIAETIRHAIKQSLRLSVSEGIGSNKLVSQIASKLKKPSAFEFVPPGRETQFLWPLGNQWLPGVGPKTGKQLNAAGLAKIGQIAQTPVDMLNLLVGGMAPQLRNFSLGIDERPIVPVCAPAKSYSEQETFGTDTTDERFIDATLRRMADKLMAHLRAEGKSIRTLTVKVRYNDMDEEQAGESLDEPTDLETDLYSGISQLLRKAWRRRVSLRMVSLKLSNVYSGRFRHALPLDAPAQRHDAQKRLAERVDELRNKFGRAAILRGHDFVLRNRKGQGEEPSVNPRGGRLGEPSLPQPLPGRDVSPKRPGSPSAQNQANSACSGRLGEPSLPQVLFEPTHVGCYKVQKRSTTCIPLNIHSYYSFLDSTLSPEAIVSLAAKHDLPAVALTDKNNLHGAVEFAQAAAKAGIKPIIGTEVEWKGKRLCLYVQNQTGYSNLCHILNTLPREKNSLPLFAQTDTEGLLAVSPDAELARWFSGRFYLEVNSLETLEKCSSSPQPCVAAFPAHYELPSDRWKYDVVQSIRTLTLLRQQHPEKRLEGEYHFRSPSEMRRLLDARPELLARSLEIADRCSFTFSLGTPQFPSYPPPDGSTPTAFLKKLVMDGLRRRYPTNHARLKPQLEQELAIITDVGYEEYFLVMWDILQDCRRAGIEWITRGSAADSLACYCLEISGVCPIRFDLYFRRFLNKDRMALNKLPDIDVDFAHDRKDDVIDLIFRKFGTANTAIVGGFSTFQSRSAFAEVAKVLGVSDFQARRITERFPYYSHPGDLIEAMDSIQELRDLPLDQEPYSTALQMARFLDGFPRYAKMHPCGLVLSRQPMREITPCFTSAKGYPTTHFDMDSVEAVGLVKMDILAQGGLAVMRDVKAMLLNAQQARDARSVLECGSPPSAVLRRTGPLPLSVTDAIPKRQRTAALQDASRDENVEAQPCANTKCFDLDLNTLEPWEDPRVWDLIASGGARAVHHIESPAMISLCKMCNVRDIDTLIAIVSVIRPGAANESKKMEFARRYQGLSPVRYPHPSLEPCLRSTYGLVVYEEHILQICEAFAGLPPGRADVLRRALGKDKGDIIVQIGAEFAACARKNGRTETEIAEVWKLVAGFRGYAFCKAHSTAYGVEAYQSAWLKRYYPAEFMAAVLTNGKGFYHPLVYVLECHRLGTPLLPPSINEPGPHFSVTHGKIRVPVLNVKGLTQQTADAIVAERARGEFASLADFFLRVQPLPEEMEALIRVGAFDSFSQSRTTQYWEFKSLGANRGPAKPKPKRAKTSSKPALCSDPASAIPPASIPDPARTDSPSASLFSAPPRQLWLFPPVNLDRLPSIPLAEPDRLQRLRWEEELLGYPASGHPLELFPDIAWETYCPVNRLANHVGEQIVTCGLVIEQRMFHQVTGEPMKFLTIADWTGVVETELFAKTYKSYGLNTVRYRVLEITATVEPFENGRGFTLRVLRAGKPRIQSQHASSDEAFSQRGTAATEMVGTTSTSSPI